MNKRYLTMMLLIFSMMLACSSICLCQATSPILVVYGTMYDQANGLPVNGGYTIIARNLSKSITLETSLGIDEEAGKYKIIFIDYMSNNAVELDEIIQIKARFDSEAREYIYAEHIVTVEDIAEKMIRIDITEGVISVDSFSWGAIKSLFK